MKLRIDTHEMPDGLSLRIDSVLAFNNWDELANFVEVLEKTYYSGGKKDEESSGGN